VAHPIVQSGVPVNVQSLSPGMYTVELWVRGQHFSSRVVKE
jgi:hypothetical protein